MSFLTAPFLQLTIASQEDFIVTQYLGSEAISALFHYSLTVYSTN